MFARRSISGATKVGCANLGCQNRSFPAKELLFLCPQRDRKCPGAGKGDLSFLDDDTRQRIANLYADRNLFRPRSFHYEVNCPACGSMAYLKLCPSCLQLQPVSTGDGTTIAVIGAQQSGKTCFITSLIHQIDHLLARQAMFGMGLHWRDDTGRAYFRNQYKTMFNDFDLPQPNQKNAPATSLDIQVTFPVRGILRRMVHGSHSLVPLVFPDPAGEIFHNLDDAHILSFLVQAPQVMFILDPFSSRAFQERRKTSTAGFDGVARESPETALTQFVEALKREIGGKGGKIQKDLAVVLTKCDEEGVFDPDDEANALPPQGRFYSPQAAADLSDQVRNFLEEEMDMANVVVNALNNFANVSFFAATALGRAPKIITVGTRKMLKLDGPPKPRRVEEPFLWLLHRRGLI